MLNKKNESKYIALVKLELTIIAIAMLAIAIRAIIVLIINSLT